MQKDLLHSLREKGLRITPLKKTILSILEKAEEPLSVPDLQIQLKKRKMIPNKTSLYRELQTLTEVNAVEEIQLFKDIRSYELKRADEHHHHFVCEECKEVVDFENKELEASIQKIARLLKRKGHQPTDHYLNLYGLCASCR